MSGNQIFVLSVLLILASAAVLGTWAESKGRRRGGDDS
jgi:hypothetical protein